MPTFDVGQLLSDNGLELTGVNEDGSYQVTDAEGNAKTFDAKAMLADQKIKGVDIAVNTPDSPLDQSPVSFADRAKLALGNTRGQLNYLKGKFEDVRLHPDNGLLVKQHGVWQRVDKSEMDAWELTKDVAEGVVGMALPLAGSAAGAAGGAIAGAGIGGVAGAGAGGALGEAARTSLGRLVGTYDATPEEQLKDVAVEGLFNLGGQAVALGVKPTAKMLGQAVKNISKWAAPGTKEVLTSVYGSITGAGQTAMRAALERTDGVVRETARAAKQSGGNVLRAVETLKSEQVDTLKGLVEMADDGLTKKFRALQADVLESVPDSLTANVADDVKAVYTALEQQGLGKMTAKGFRMSTMEDIEKLVASGVVPDRINETSLGALEKLTKELGVYARTPQMKGKEAAKAVLNIRRSIQDAVFTIKDELPDAASGKLSEFSKLIDNRLKGYFLSDKTLAEKFASMNNTYKEYVDVVREGKRVVRGQYDPEIFVNKLVSNPGSQATAKGYADKLAEIAGSKASIDSIIEKEGAKAFVRWLPNTSRMTPIMTGTAGAVAVGAGAVNPVTAGLAATQASPRIVLKQIEYGRKLMDFFGQLPANQKAQLLANPTLVRSTFATMASSMQDENDAEAELLRQAGIQK